MKKIRDDVDLASWVDDALEGETGWIGKSEYNDGQTALMLIPYDGRLVVDLTAKLAGVSVKDDEILVDNTADKDGILSILINEKLVSKPDRTVHSQTSQTEYPICKYIGPRDIETPERMKP